jgi:hypothetical protein
MRASPVDPVWRMKMMLIAGDLGLGSEQWMRVHVVFVDRLNFVPASVTGQVKPPAPVQWREPAYVDHTAHIFGTPALGAALARFWVDTVRWIWWRSR